MTRPHFAFNLLFIKEFNLWCGDAKRAVDYTIDIIVIVRETENTADYQDIF